MVINPRCACAERVTVLSLSVSISRGLQYFVYLSLYLEGYSTFSICLYFSRVTLLCLSVSISRGLQYLVYLSLFLKGYFTLSICLYISRVNSTLSICLYVYLSQYNCITISYGYLHGHGGRIYTSSQKTTSFAADRFIFLLESFHGM